MITKGKDLTQTPPSSPRKRTKDYVILARLADKARAAFLGGNVGAYHTNCPLDHILLDWKGVKYEEIKEQILLGADDEALASYLTDHGIYRSKEEIKQWSHEAELENPYSNPEKRAWYAKELKKLGLPPETTTLFSWLEADDRASFSDK